MSRTLHRNYYDKPGGTIYVGKNFQLNSKNINDFLSIYSKFDPGESISSINWLQLGVLAKAFYFLNDPFEYKQLLDNPEDVAVIRSLNQDPLLKIKKEYYPYIGNINYSALGRHIADYLGDKWTFELEDRYQVDFSNLLFESSSYCANQLMQSLHDIDLCLGNLKDTTENLINSTEEDERNLGEKLVIILNKISTNPKYKVNRVGSNSKLGQYNNLVSQYAKAFDYKTRKQFAELVKGTEEYINFFKTKHDTNLYSKNSQEKLQVGAMLSTLGRLNTSLKEICDSHGLIQDHKRIDEITERAKYLHLTAKLLKDNFLPKHQDPTNYTARRIRRNIMRNS